MKYNIKFVLIPTFMCRNGQTFGQQSSFSIISTAAVSEK